jgi:hypothetical protein
MPDAIIIKHYQKQFYQESVTKVVILDTNYLILNVNF